MSAGRAQNRTVIYEDNGANLVKLDCVSGNPGDASLFLPVLPAGSKVTILGVPFWMVGHELMIDASGLTTLKFVVTRTKP